MFSSFKIWISALCLLAMAGCDRSEKPSPTADRSYAIYAEFAKDANILMKPGLNRRVFNTTEAQHGSKIQLAKDGSITLQPGTYRLTGFSSVTMQNGFAAPASSHDLNYPGYALVYPREFETSDPLRHAIGIGSAGSALDASPSLVDLVFTCPKVTQVCVGHQSGEELNGEVYLSVYDVDGMKSPFHVFARVAIFEL
jgi:hypothetical protein